MIIESSKHRYEVDDENWNIHSNGESKIDITGNYFIKRFISMKLPNPIDSPKVKEEKRKKADRWVREQNQLLGELTKLAGPSGNLLVPFDFFNDGKMFYKVTYAIKTASLGVDTIIKLPMDKKILFLRTLAGCIKILHQAKVVHADLKPENILIGKSITGNYISKVIDFDDSFFECHPPENVVGTEPYYSPELARYINGKCNGYEITTKSDIFALGIIFHKYLTDNMPGYDTKSYVYMLAMDDKPIKVSNEIPQHIRNLIVEMLNTNPAKRPDINAVYNRLLESKESNGNYILDLGNGKYSIYAKNVYVKTIPYFAFDTSKYPGYEIRKK